MSSDSVLKIGRDPEKIRGYAIQMDRKPEDVLDHTHTKLSYCNEANTKLQSTADLEPDLMTLRIKSGHIGLES